jgi:hypothetical protein
MTASEPIQYLPAGVTSRRRVVCRPPLALVAPFMIGVFFPYLAILPLGTDLQPTALIFSALICLLYGFGSRPPRPLLLLGIPVLAGVAVLLISNLDFNSLRSLANYTSFFLVAVGTFLAARHPLISNKRTLDVANLIWLAVGLVQTLYDPLFLSELLSNFRTTPTRGVVSLAAEPSFYGIACVVFLLLYYLQNRETSPWALLCFVQILFLAKSPTAALILAVGCLVYVLLNCNMKVLAVVLLLCLIVGIGWQADLLADSRLETLTTWALQNPTTLLVRDHSASARFYHIAYSFKGALAYGLLPHGFSAWARYLDGQLGRNSNRYLGYYLESPDRIMSAMGGAFFELGLFAVAIPIALFKGAQTFFGTLASRRALAYCVTMCLVMLNSVPLGFPLYGFLIGYCYAHRSYQFAPAARKARLRFHAS